MLEVTSNYVAKDVEAKTQQFWKDKKIYPRIKAQYSDGIPWVFIDGPPYTTGDIHIGTAWNKIIKDSVLRYRRMLGYNVFDRAGYDMHGLPIEVKVESLLGFHNKRDIEAYGVEKFIQSCEEYAVKQKKLMDTQFEALGIWMDFEGAYQTITPDYIDAAWWILKIAEEKGLLENGYRVVNWCPRCGTAIADSEVEYWDEKDPSVYVKFPVTKGDEEQEAEYLVIWTTTPWTLPANVAVAVGEQYTYAKVKAEKDGVIEYLWIAEDLAEQVLKKGKYRSFEICETRTGKQLAGMVYHSPLVSSVPHQAEIHHQVYVAEFVEMDNSGMVHIAPGHGWDDYILGIKEGLEIFCPVDGAGKFTKDAGVFEGLSVREANETVCEALGSYLLSKLDVSHRYGHCWRCKTPIIFRATEQWFLAIPKVKEIMLAEIKATTWYPDWAGSARFHDFVSDAREWCISRQRYWGIPIPVWRCDSCTKRQVFGTLSELNEAAGTNLTNPHRPYVDDVTISCSCGGVMKRVLDVFDVWFDSGMATWATHGFPGKKEGFERYWPADWIIEGQDQTRGWFYSQLGASVIGFHKAPYKQVTMHGFLLDQDGRKMSKSLGNSVTPSQVAEKYGVDTFRLYSLSAGALWDDLKFNWENIANTHRALNILWNVHRFPLPYMIMDGFVPVGGEDGTWDESYILREIRSMPLEDRWIISRINSLAQSVTKDMNEYLLHKVTRALITFILEDLSRWYIQLVRPRMWDETDSDEKRYAYETMYYCQRMLNRLLAPFTPHIAEDMYQHLRLEHDPESVHMRPWISGSHKLIDEPLEAWMEVIRNFDEAVANARQNGKRKLRWPVRRVVVAAETDIVEEAFSSLVEIARTRANAYVVEVVRGKWQELSCTAEPYMKKIGPEFGKEGPRVKALIEAADGPALQAELKKNGETVLRDGDTGFFITNEHVNFIDSLPDGVFSASMDGATVYVDTTLTPQIEAEAYARELIRRIQDMRKQLSLHVDECIELDVVLDDVRIAALVDKQMQELIAREVRATEYVFYDKHGLRPPEKLSQIDKDWDIEGVSVT
ncbi:MAG: isoleucine--tRNA ligase, partial [Methanomicrobiales archaeon]|nr:isoleucine--tRNA ligase [Methanomicrobiales archaeon]